MKTKNYIDNLYYTLIGTYLVCCISMAVLIIILNVNDFCYYLAWIMLGLLLLLTFFFYDRKYYLEKDCLKIGICFITITVPYKNIEKVYMTRNNRVSYATSQKRIGLKIKGRKKDIFISPDKMDDVYLNLSGKINAKKANKK